MVDEFPALATPGRWLRNKRDGTIYGWTQVLANNPLVEEVTEEVAFPEKFIPIMYLIILQLLRMKRGKMILNDIITEVRRILQDETVTYRYSDTFLLGLCNQGLKRIQLLRPDLFSHQGTMTCVQGEVLQSAPTDSLRIIECFSIVGGGGLVEAKREILDQTIPAWSSATQGAAVNWMRHVRNPNKFFIYPPAPASQTLKIE